MTDRELKKRLANSGRFLNKHCEEGTPHHPKSIELYKFISAVDYQNGDSFCFKAGGDGDNGEDLMYYFNMFFEVEKGAKR